VALIKEFLEVSSERDSVHKEVSCGWRVVTVDGRRLLQLDTYGTPEREIPNKLSQSIQVDREAAAVLIDLLRNTFPGL
jgi:hypothetical protein